MAKEKTKYQFSCDAIQAQNIITQFLQANNYKQMVSKETGNIYYKYTDAIANGFLEFDIQPNITTIYVYLRSEKSPMPLNSSVYGALPKSHYKGIIEPLIKALSNANAQPTTNYNTNNESNVDSSVNNTANTTVNQMNQGAYNQFASGSEKSSSTSAIIAFIISLVTLVLSFLGFIAGVFIIFITYALAFQGLKSKNKGLAIAAIVICSVALVIGIITLFLSVVGQSL